MLDRDAQRLRAIQVGMLMRAYRESFSNPEGGRGLTQEELLRRMARVDGDYGQRYSHTTVSRWESGTTRPSKERLEVFGKALNLAPSEVSGLLALAGFDRVQDDSANDAGVDDLHALNRAVAANSDASVETDLDQPSGHETDTRSPTISHLLRSGSITVALPALAIVCVPYLLTLFGWNLMLMPIAYIGSIMGLRLAAGYLKLNKPFDLCEFMSVSIFILLTTPLLQSSLLHVDHYGFSAIADLAGTPAPYMLALLVNLFVSTVAGAMFFMLWKAQYASPRAESNPVRRALIVVMAPMVLAFVTAVLFTNVEMLIQLSVVLAVLAAVCIIMLVLRDPTLAPNDRDRRFMLWGALAIGTVMVVAGAMVIVVVYLTPNYPYMLPDHNLLFSWDIAYDRLGYPASEAMGRFNVGYLWHSMVLFVYVVFVVGGSLLAAIYRWHIDHPSSRVAPGSRSHVEVPEESQPPRAPVGSHERMTRA